MGQSLSSCQSTSPSPGLESHGPFFTLVPDLLLVMRSRAAPGRAGEKLYGVCCVNLHEFSSPANALSLGWCIQDIDFSLQKEGFFLVSRGASLKSPPAHPATATATQTVSRAGDSQGSEPCSRPRFMLKILNKWPN